MSECSEVRLGFGEAMFRGLIQMFRLCGCGGVEQHAARFVHNSSLTLGVALVISFPGLIYCCPGRGAATVNTPAESGKCVEIVPIEYRKRYNKWKATLLSADTGSRLWLKYADSPTFHLTIIVSKSEGQGAKVVDYQWHDGKLVAATIILGDQLDRGYPSRFYYPVLSSLAFFQDEADPSRDILAAAKIAHEFGHINFAASVDPATVQLQNELSAVYVSRCLSHRWNVDDPQLIGLAIRMGG